MSLRVYADFNSMTVDGWCFCLRYGERQLDYCAAELNLKEGMAVVLFYADAAEEFEVDAVLSFKPSSPLPAPQWVGRPDWETMRRIRG